MLFGTLLVSDHPWNIWCFNWFSTQLACVATLTFSSLDSVAITSEVMWWTAITSKLFWLASSGTSELTQLRASAITLSPPFRLVNSTSYFASWSNSHWSHGLVAANDFFQIGINGLWSVWTSTLPPNMYWCNLSNPNTMLSNSLCLNNPCQQMSVSVTHIWQAYPSVTRLLLSLPRNHPLKLCGLSSDQIKPKLGSLLVLPLQLPMPTDVWIPRTKVCHFVRVPLVVLLPVWPCIR